MILFQGQVYPPERQDEILEKLEECINATRETKTLDREQVIAAADRLRSRILAGEFDALIKTFSDSITTEYLREAADIMKRENIEFRLRTELAGVVQENEIAPPYGISKAKICYRPLGTLFHIAAGNVDGLPAFSVLEGLLTGNVNILKLPEADNGISIEIFLRMMEEEPLLKEYVYIFDTPSSDVQGMRKMADMSDGIVVWGGEAAVAAVRTLASPGAKIIEWGHKLGFAYLSGYEEKERDLRGLAKHIIDTRQLFCSSCQTIYIDTEEAGDLHAFCKEFLPYLDEAAEQNPVLEVGAVAEMTLRKYHASLEAALCGEGEQEECYQGKKTSLTVCDDQELELSYMYGNCLVKALPRKDLLRTLRRAKGCLQTAGLVCAPEKRRQLTDLLVRAGINRVMSAGHMSATFCGEAHDGEYPLRRYLRVVNIECD